MIRSAGGGTSYGEVNLDGGATAGGAARGAADPFGSGARRGGDGVRRRTPRARRAAPAMHTKLASTEAKHRSKAPMRMLGGLLVVAVAGGSLAFVPSVGPYGAYWIGDRLNASKHQLLLETSIAAARRETWGAIRFRKRDALSKRSMPRHKSAKRVRSFNTYLAFHRVHAGASLRRRPGGPRPRAGATHRARGRDRCPLPRLRPSRAQRRRGAAGSRACRRREPREEPTA